MTENKLQKYDNNLMQAQTFEGIQAIARVISKSDIIPAKYQGNEANIIIALELARRINESILMVMQHLDIIKGKPTWSSTYLIASINKSPRFNSLKFRYTGTKGTETWGCIAYTTDKETGEILEGPEITMKIAQAEGWVDRSGSKWKTIPEIMLTYRAASFFSRIHCPEITLGLQTKEETQDYVKESTTKNEYTKQKERVEKYINDCTDLEQLNKLANIVDQFELTDLFNNKKNQLSNGNTNIENQK